MGYCSGGHGVLKATVISVCFRWTLHLATKMQAQQVTGTDFECFYCAFHEHGWIESGRDDSFSRRNYGDHGDTGYWFFTAVWCEGWSTLNLPTLEEVETRVVGKGVTSKEQKRGLLLHTAGLFHTRERRPRGGLWRYYESIRWLFHTQSKHTLRKTFV